MYYARTNSLHEDRYRHFGRIRAWTKLVYQINVHSFYFQKWLKYSKDQIKHFQRIQYIFTMNLN